MATLIVWHKKNPTFGLGPIGNFPDDFKKVAEFITPDNNENLLLEFVWASTQHAEYNWTKQKPEEEYITLNVIEPKSRSTSVGDIIELNSVPYIVDMTGFKPYNNPNEKLWIKQAR